MPAQAWNEDRSDPKPEPGSRTYAMMRRKASPATSRMTSVRAACRDRFGVMVARSGRPEMGDAREVRLLHER
jgi:hypothetical protein